MAQDEQRIPSRSWLLLVLAGLAGMLFYIDRQTLSVMKTTLKGTFGWSDVHYSWLVGAFMVPYTACYLVTGWMIDRWGTRLMMPCFLGVMSAATLASGLSTDFWQLAACRLVLGAAEAGIVPAVLVTIVTWFPPNRRGIANTLNKPLTVAGNILVVPLAAWLAAHFEWRWAFFVPGVLGLLVARAWWVADQRPPAYHGPGPSEGASSCRAVLRRRELWGLVAARVISDPLWFFLIFWQPGYLQEALGMPLEKLGWVGWIPFAVSLLGNMAAGVFSDWLIDRGWAPARSRIRILQGMALIAPVVFLLPSLTSHAWALAALSVVQLMAAAWLSLSGLLMADLVPRRQVGTAVAVVSAFGAGVGALCNLAVGPLIELLGYGPVFAVGALLHPCAALVLWWNYTRPRPAAAA